MAGFTTFDIISATPARAVIELVLCPVVLAGVFDLAGGYFDEPGLERDLSAFGVVFGYRSGQHVIDTEQFADPDRAAVEPPFIADISVCVTARVFLTSTTSNLRLSKSENAMLL